MPSEKIVVSGYSCRLPESDSASEFWDNLVAHKDMVTADDRRWPVDFLDIPPRFGKLKTLDKFDAQFFEVHAKQANKMDPQLRLLMEVSYEAIKSAGVNPSDLSGTNTGVFVGASSNDADSIFGASIDGLSGYENTGCASSMFANRLSYSFNFTGPSETIDTACSSSLVALHAAMQALALGECDRALVAGCNVILRPNTTVGFKKLKMVAEDGTSRSFDEKGSGFARAEGIVAILLCKESLAHRIIATVLGSATNNDGYTEQGITYPSGQAQHNLLCGLYQRQGIDPAQVKYIEAHGTGTHAGDPQEANALTDFFCATRPASELPLLIGSVKSNMGHSEPAAGLAGMVKVLLSMEHKLIPANLHYDSPNPEIPGLADGRLRVVDSNMAWDGGIVGISSFGFGGTNAHVILEDNCDAKHTEDAPLPIIPFAARTKEAFDTLSEYAASDRITKDETQLLQRVAAARGNTHPFRGCVVRLNNGLIKTQANNEVRTKPPVWFVFPGMGAQWPGMGAALLEFSTFSDAILRCAAALKDTEIDLYKIINAEIDAQRLSVTEIFVSLTAIQIGLVDLMGSLGIRADGMIGHSVGEIACGYADGGLSAEQAILAAYWRGQCVLDTPEVAGKMAVVPMDWESAGVICPQQVDRACHNSADSVTLSGNARAIDKLVEELLAQDIDARTVNSSGIAFHSVNMAKIAPNLQQKLESIIPDPKMRSDRWISSSRPTHEWNLAATCSAEYYANNLCNPVRFYEALQHIPENAVIIEIGAHTLMRKAIVDTVNGCCHVGLMVKERNNTDDFLEALAKCYTQGIDLNWQEIYPVTTPITSGCDIPGLTGWDHTQSWEVPSYKNYIAGGGPGMEIPFHIDINEEEFAYLGDHKINDKVLFPGVGYLFLVWKKLAQLHNTPLGKLPICFENVSIDRATALYSDAPVELTVRYMSASATFEIVNRSERVAHGRVRVGADVQADLIPGDHVAPEHSEAMALSKEEIYKEFRLRNYQYGPSFRQLSSLNVDGSGGVIDWDGNWVTFLDAILQSSLLKIDRQTVVPTRFRRFAIDPTRQPDTGQIQLFSHTFLPQIHSAAVRLDGLECAPISVVSKIESPTLSAYEFMPYHCIAPRDDYIADYLRTTEHYIIDAALSAIKTAEENLWSIPEHIERLKQELLKHESLSQTQFQAQPQWRNKLAMYMAEPNAFHLRLAEYIFSDPKPLFENALARIVSYPDYHQIYKSDLRVALLFNDRYLGSLVDIVLENAAAVSPIRVCEVGAGTGGISDHILRKLYNNKFKYIFTDVSAGFFEKLRKNFDQYSAVTDFQPWDIRDALPHSIGGPVDLIVASNCIHAVPNLRTALHNIREALTEQGFFLLHEATSTHYAVLSTWGFIDQLWHYDDPQDRSSGAYLTRSKWEGLLDECGFDIVATQEDRVESAIFLCRKRSDTQKHIQSLCLTSDISVDVPAIQSQLYQTQAQAQPQSQSQSQPQPQPQEVHNGDEHRFWLQGDAQTSPGLVGMVNCLRREPGSESIRCLYEDEPGQLQEAEKAARYPLDLAVNVYKDGQWGSYRHVPVDIPAVNTQNAYLDIENTGDLSTLRWFEAENWRLERMEFEPYYFGLNFKAVMMATGKLIDAGNAADKLFKRIGGEFAGVAKDGRRVMGYIEESFSTKMVQDTGSLSCIFEVPEQWTLKQAATVPVVYLTAYLALLLRAKLQPGERILIHAGSGGVGQAAINIALSMGCEIFTTVGTDQKRDFIKTTFPAIAPENIGNSRDTSFEELVMVRTQGKGVDVVLNSLSDEKLHASLRVLAPRGRFVEIGRYDMMQDTPIGMSTFVHEASFYGIYLDNVLDANNPESGKLFKLLSDGINAGVVKPLHHMVFNKDQVTEAFRYMSRGKHIGKVLIGLRDEDDKRPLALEAKRKFWCHPEKTYVVTGGLGGVGLELAEWLVQRGAKSLVITSRSGIKNNYQRFRINCWQAKGVQVLVSGKNVANVDEAESLLKEAQAINPVGGVFHLAMVLEDALFINQSVERFQNVYDIKFGGGRNLDRLSRKLCPSLEKFVVFSSISSGLGNGGQTNYGLANSAMERLCERRKKDGYPALAIQWGIIGDVGFVADNKLQVHIGSYPIMAQSIHSCLETLDQFVNQDSPVVFSATYDLDLRANHATSQHASKQDLSVEGLIESVKRILGMSGDHEVSEDRTLSELGMDSLMAVEIEHVFNSDYDLNTSLAKVRNLTIADIKKLYFHRYEQAQGETTGDAMTSTEDDQAFALTEVIMPFHVVPQATQAIYFVNGFMVDSRGVLEDLHFPKTCNAYSVHYELTESMGELADTWKAHIESLAAENITVHIVGFSLGALIAQRFAKLLELAGVDVAVNIIGISPPKLELFKLVEQYTLEQIDAMSVDQGMEYARSMPFYGEFAMLGVKQIMNQARFMMHDHFYSKELAQADLIVLPVDDNLCYSKQEAMKFSQRIIATDGNHIVSTIDFEKIWLEANIG